jgi:hypothetical protein
MLTTLTACDNAADVASRNVATAAANFEVNRRIVFYNVRNGEYRFLSKVVVPVRTLAKRSKSPVKLVRTTLRNTLWG